MQRVLPATTLRPGRRPHPLAAYQLGAASVVALVAWALVSRGWSIASPPVVFGLAAVAFLAEGKNVSLADRVVVSVSLLPALFAAVLLGPLPGMIVYATSALGLGFPIMGRLTYAMNRALIGAGAGLSASLMHHLIHSSLAATVIAASAGAVCAAVTDVCLTTLTFRSRGHRAWKPLVKDLLPMVLAASPFYASMVALLALAYSRVSPWTLPLFFAPALAAQRFFVLYQDQQRLTTELVKANGALEAANLSFASALVATLDARDRYTAGHSAAVAIYARDIAEEMGLPAEQQQLAHVCGLVHDIGKIGLPAGLLEKPGALTPDERVQMQLHSEIGERILANVDTYAEIASIVRHHHEQVDGRGYPDGLALDEIPLLSRIIAVADAYNAMTSDRPYRTALSSDIARRRLEDAVGTQFEAIVVDAFESILRRASDDYQAGRLGRLTHGFSEPPDFEFGRATLVPLSA